jgi:beta-N-acetylhexosaminidase
MPALRRQLAQLLIVGIDGTRPGAANLATVGQGVGGVILFGRNVESASQVKALIGGLDEAAGGTLAVGVDQEPGTKVSRLKGMVPATPSARVMGTWSSARIQAAATELARAMARLGVTVDFAPDLDVTGSDAGVIGNRSFGADPERAGRAGTAFMRGLEAGGILPVGKHFPGHGATLIDSHAELPTVDLPLAELRARHLAPFRTAIAAGLPAVMVAHLRVTAIDPSGPATLSGKVTTGLLKEQLGFDGLVVTDDLEMGAVTNSHSVAEGAELALRAGADWLLIGAPSNAEVRAVVQRLEAAVAAGRVGRERVRDAFLHVQRAKGDHHWDACR